MTKGEAVAVNVVLTALIGQKQALDAVRFAIPQNSAMGIVTAHAERLAEGAHKVLAAGITVEQVRRSLRENRGTRRPA